MTQYFNRHEKKSLHIILVELDLGDWERCSSYRLINIQVFEVLIQTIIIFSDKRIVLGTFSETVPLRCTCNFTSIIKNI